MKKTILTICISLVVLCATLATISTYGKPSYRSLICFDNITALATGEGGYSCTVTTNCMSGSVSCTGTKCERGPGYVTCNGNKTVC